MRDFDSNQVALLPKGDDSGFSFPIDAIIIDRADDTYETAPTIHETTLADSARILTDKLAAQKDSFKKTALSTALSEAPEIVHHLTSHLPVVGPVISAVTFIQELDEWKCTWNMLQDFLRFNRQTPQESFLKPTLEYIVHQFENKKFKQEILLYGKLVQLGGSITTTAALFTGGVTLIPGLIISSTGSLIRVSVNIRSFIRYKLKKDQNSLSVARSEHAAKLFALSIEHIKRKRHVDLVEYLNDPAYERYAQAKSMSEEINAHLSPEEQDFNSMLSALVIRKLQIKHYPGRRDPSLETMPEFLRLGYYEIFNALKS